jgi:hypothetical protein
MTRDEIVEFLEDAAPGWDDITLFDGLEDAFVGVAERFEEGGHHFFAVYSYEKMIDALMGPDMTREDAAEYISFNVIDCYGGPDMPAIVYEVPA